MSATITEQASEFSACYGREIPFKVTRTDPTASQVVSVKAAAAADVTTHGNGLVEGDILVTHADLQGSIPAAVGQHLVLTGCDDYSGVHKITKLIDQSGGTNYLVIDAGEQVEFAGSGTVQVWLYNYRIIALVEVFDNYDALNLLETVTMYEVPEDGVASFDIAPVLRRFFDYSDVQSAWATGVNYRHAKWAGVAYRITFKEEFLNTAQVSFWSDITSLKAGINAVHPHIGPSLDYQDANMDAYKVGTSTSLWLTHLDREQVVRSNQSFCLSIIESSAFFNPSIRIEQLNGTIIQDVSIIQSGDLVSACNVGPRDLAAILPSGITGYRVSLISDLGSIVYISEKFTFIIDDECSESDLTFQCLNKLGGLDSFHFGGRKHEDIEVERTTVSKEYGTPGAMSHNTRMQRVKPVRTFTISTKPISTTRKKEVGNSLLESAVVFTEINGVSSHVIILDDGQRVHTTKGEFNPLTMQYQLGVDNISQEG